MTKPKSLTAAALAVLFLAACGSTGGGLGDILGGGDQASNYEIRGTVDRVDPNSRSVYLTNVSGMTSMLSNSGSGSGSSVRVYYDNQTTVVHQGQSHRPEDLERGDEVTVRVSESTNNTLIADTVTVTRDVSGTNTSYPGSVSGSVLRGTVTYVDESRRTIEVNRGFGSNVIVEYGTSTPVYFNGQTYRPADLERGDEIEISVRDLGSNRFSANDITVVRSVSSTTGSTSSTMQTVRGTVSYVDTNRRTIELESASWISRFNTGTGTGGSRVVISYDNNVSVDVAGRLHPVSGLERGDVVEVQVDNFNNAMRATRIVLVRDVNDLR